MLCFVCYVVLCCVVLVSLCCAVCVMVCCMRYGVLFAFCCALCVMGCFVNSQFLLSGKYCTLFNLIPPFIAIILPMIPHMIAFSSLISIEISTSSISIEIFSDFCNRNLKHPKINRKELDFFSHFKATPKIYCN